MLVKDLQFSKATAPILVTLFGISMLSKFWHSAKAAYPMIVTLLGIVTLVKD